MGERLPPGGAVLTGGASRRMGRDKTLIEVDGRPLAARAVAALRSAGADPIVCVGGDLGALGRAGLTAVPDRHPGAGPLGGVLTALRAVTTEVVVILAADLARPDPAAIGRVVDALGDADIAVPVADGRRQWLHGAWRRRTAVAVLDAAFTTGERAIHRAVAGLTVADVGDVATGALVDLDRPEDVAALRRRTPRDARGAGWN